jgi:hypothetical protein
MAAITAGAADDTADEPGWSFGPDADKKRTNYRLAKAFRPIM